MKLNLGAGTDRMRGFTSVDIDPSTKPDVIWDLREFPYPWDTNSIDEILLENTIEHISYRLHDEIFKELYRILKRWGILVVVCPDIISLFMQYIYNHSDPDSHNKFVHFLFGGHEHEHDYHNAGYTELLIRHKLRMAGFSIADFEPGMKVVAIK